MDKTKPAVAGCASYPAVGRAVNKGDADVTGADVVMFSLLPRNVAR